MGQPAVQTLRQLLIFRLGRYLRNAGIVCGISLVAACTSAPQSTPVYVGNYQDRAQTQEKEGIRVTAGVPSAEESKDLFGEPLYRRGVQPVWLKIENNRDEYVSFLPVGLDPTYYAPEVSACSSFTVRLAASIGV